MLRSARLSRAHQFRPTPRYLTILTIPPLGRCVVSSLSYVYENTPVPRPVDARHSIESETNKAVSLCLESEMFQQAKVEAKERVKRNSILLPVGLITRSIAQLPEPATLPPNSAGVAADEAAIPVPLPVSVNQISAPAASVFAPVHPISSQAGPVAPLAPASPAASLAPAAPAAHFAPAAPLAAPVDQISAPAASVAAPPLEPAPLPEPLPAMDAPLPATTAESVQPVAEPESESSLSSSEDGEAATVSAFKFPEMPEMPWRDWMPCLGRQDMKTAPVQPPVEESSESDSSEEE